MSDFTNDPTIRYVDVPTTKLYNDPLYGKPRAARVDQGLANTRLRVPLVSSDTGAPLTAVVGSYSSAPTIQARYREASGVGSTVLDALGGLSADGTVVAIDLPTAVSDAPGIFTVQFRILDSAGIERERNELWVMVDRGMWRSDGNPGIEAGIPTTREVRNVMRDHPGANRLLGEYEFDTAEIAQAVVSAVQAFDTDFPPSGVHVPTTGWPVTWRRPLLDGVMAYLFDVAAIYHRRGLLPYASGGISINDLNKEENYLKAAELLRAKYVKWVKFTRMSISLRGGFASQGSGYTIGRSTVGGYWG
jgi:hypothetical protein